MTILIERVRKGTLATLLVVVVVALFACKKGDSTGDSSSDESGESDSSKDDDATDDDATVAQGDDSQGDTKVADNETPFKAGDPVDVEWKGDWWKAEVKRARSGPAYYIHYVGWGDDWDEWVGPRRIRARTAGSRTK